MKHTVKNISGEKQGNSILSRISAAFFIVLTSVFPLYITGTKYSYITKQKTVFFVTSTGIAVAAVIIVLLFFIKRLQVKNYFMENEPKRSLSVSDWALIAFILFTFVSACVSPWQDTVWNGFTWDGYTGRWEGFWVFLCYVLTYFVISRFYKPKRLHFLLFAGSAVLVSIYGVLQFAGLDVLAALPSDLHLYSEFLTTLGHANVVSAYASFAAVLFAALFVGEESKWGFVYLVASAAAFALLLAAHGDGGKVGTLGAMVLLIPYWLSDRRRLGKICIVLSCWSVMCAGYHGYFTFLKSHPGGNTLLSQQDWSYLELFVPKNWAAFLVAAAALLAIGLYLLLMLKRWPERNLKVIGGVVLAAVIIGGLLFVEVMGTRWENQSGNIVWEAREILHGRLDDSFGTNRGWVWKRGLSVLGNHPIFGTGPDTFYYALGDELQRESVARYDVTFSKAHNTYLQYAVCMGIPALLAYMVFLGGLFTQAIRKAFDRPILLAFGAAALCFAIQSFFEIDTPIDRPLLWVSLGVLAGEIWRSKIGA